MKNPRAIVLLGACLFAAGVSSAHADNSVCASALLVVPDGSSHEGDLPAGPGVRWYRFVAKAGRSYAIMLENLTTPDQQAEIAITGVFGVCGGSEIPHNDVTDFQEPVSLDTADFVGATRAAVKISADTGVFFLVNHIDVSNAAHFRVRVEETTQFNPFWSTNGGFDTHYRLYNTTNKSCSVTLDLRTDSNAAPVAGVSSATFTLAANNSTARNTGASDLNVANGQSGHATIAHDCPPGAIQVDAFLSTNNGNRMLPLKVTSARQQR